MNWATAITLFRVMLIPVFMVLVLTAEGRDARALLAAAVFVFAALTDGLDGYVARARKEVTKTGKLLDPVADKLLISTALIVLVDMDRISAWPAAIIVAREFAISGLRILLASEGVILAASQWAKVKTVSQIIGVSAVLLAFPWGPAVLWVAVAATLISGGEYFLRARSRINARLAR